MNDLEKEKPKPVIAVVGGGPAGLMSSISAAERNTSRIILFEKNPEPGRKLLLTGNGRCNITNDSEVGDFIAHVFEGAKFLRKSLHTFSPSDSMVFFENAGVALKTEENGRIFPVSDRAADVLAALVRKAKALGVEIRQNEEVHQINTSGERPKFHLETDRSSYRTDACIICTGGASYPMTGSDGNSLRLAVEMGHLITPVRAGLSPVKLEGIKSSGLAGVSLRGVRLRLIVNGSKEAETKGDILFTHIGVTGPAVLRLSRSAPADLSRYKDAQVSLLLTIMPEITDGEFERLVLGLVMENPNRLLSNVLKELAPEAYILFILSRISIAARTFCRDLKKEERQRLIRALRNEGYAVTEPPDINSAMITVGGIATSQIDPNTMQSRLVPGLYFAGEALDVDADTGGYNLQIAFSTGFVAGRHAASVLNEEA
jgi:predicted Rossmann fold flavoprotein